MYKQDVETRHTLSLHPYHFDINKILRRSIQCHGTFRSGGRFRTPAIDTLLQFFNQEIQYRHEYQRQEGSEDQSEDHCPGQRPPEGDVITTKINVGVEFSE